MTIKNLMYAVVGLLAFIGGGYALLHMVDIGGRGGTSNGDTIQLDGSLTLGTFLTVGAGTGASVSAGQATGLTEYPVTGTCNTASSTIFAISNPFAATSTLVFAEIGGTQGATTTDIVVATSTTLYPARANATATSSLGANILNLAAISASTQFFATAGATLGSGSGFTNPKGIVGSVSQVPIVLGPNETIVAVSSSTALTGGGGYGATQVSVPSACVYKLNFRR